VRLRHDIETMAAAKGAVYWAIRPRRGRSQRTDRAGPRAPDGLQLSLLLGLRDLSGGSLIAVQGYARKPYPG
jgi:hypothetical protein